jgi:hypothetical protein
VGREGDAIVVLVNVTGRTAVPPIGRSTCGGQEGGGATSVVEAAVREREHRMAMPPRTAAIVDVAPCALDLYCGRFRSDEPEMGMREPQQI